MKKNAEERGCFVRPFPSRMARYIQRNIDPQIRLMRIPLHTPTHHPRGKAPVSTDVDVQAVGLVATTSFVGWDVCLAVVLRVPRGTGVDYLDDDSAVDLGGGGGVVGTDVVDAVAGAAAYCSGGAGRGDVVGGWILAAVCGANAGVVMEVHVRLATGAQACRDVLANVAGGSGEDAGIVWKRGYIRTGAYCTSLIPIVVERCDALHSDGRWRWSWSWSWLSR